MCVMSHVCVSDLQVNFEEFKEGFVAVLSRSLDFSTSEDDSSYLQPVVPEEVKPKFVKGTKRYGRRSCPDSQPDCAPTCDSGDSLPSRTEAIDAYPAGVHRAKLRRSTSLESVESLKSDEEAVSPKNIQPECQFKGGQQEEEELDVVVGGGHVLTAVCDHLSLQQLNTEELDVLLDANLNGRVSLKEFQKVLYDSTPISCSTPIRGSDLQRALQTSQAVLQEGLVCSTSPSLLTATVGQRVLSRLDDGSGCTSPERVIAFWTEEGIRNSRDILQTLDFPLEERLSLADLTLALDNELLVSGNSIQQATLISYKNELQHLQVVAEQACRERDKVKSDLDLADQRNLQLVREVDDRHAIMETLNQSRIRDLEQDFRDRLMDLRSQSEQESEALLQQVDRERGALHVELQLLRVQQAGLQEELYSATQENGRLEEELSVVRRKLAEAESSVSRLQRDLEQLLQDKFGHLDQAGAGLSYEERFSEIVREYELQCRELQDRNDELSSELELLKSQRSDRKSRCFAEKDTLSWTEQQHSNSPKSDSDDSDMQRSLSPLVRKKLQPVDKTALCSLDSVSGPVVSIQTELALEQLKQRHNQELQQLHIQLETQVNYYERSQELMRQSMEVERKDICQAFKLEISELEEQKVQAEQQVKQLKEALDKLQTQIQHGGGGWSSEQERRMQHERAELEQNFAREISNLVQRLSTEKDQLEAELKLQMNQELMLVREEAEQQLSQMKLQHAEGQRRFLHQLHLEHQRLQEQSVFWEKKLVQSEQEKLRCEERAGEEQAQIYTKFPLEKRMEEQQQEVHLLREQVCSLQQLMHTSSLNISQSESSLQEFRERCGQLADDLRASGERCCTQLKESISFLEFHEVFSKCQVSEKSSEEEQLQVVRSSVEMQLQVERLKEELETLQTTSNILLQDREVVADNCSHLSDVFKDQTVCMLRSELVALQEATRTKVDRLSRLTAELDSLKADRTRLIQDLKEQAIAVDHLQLEMNSISEELCRRRSAEESLQEALKQEQTRTWQFQCSLHEEREEVSRLSQESGSYTRLANQLSTQIVEMEEEITSLRGHLQDLSTQLNDTTDLVLDLRRQLNSRTSEVDQLRALMADGGELSRRAEASSEKHRSDILQLQQALQDSQEDFDREKKKMTQQLVELETLVLALEEVMDPASPHRTQLEEVRSENGTLQERLSILQQEVTNLEDDVSKKRRKLEEMEQEHKRSREEEERLHKENSRYREEVLDLSSRNLQLSNDNAELSARLCGDQESVRMLQERLALVTKVQEEEGATVRRLQDAAVQQEKEKLQQQAVWTQERQLLERELSCCKEKLGCLSEVEVELSSVILEQNRLEEDKANLLMEANDRNKQMEKLQQALLSLESEAKMLRSQLHAVSQEKLSHTQEMTDVQRKLQDAQNKVEELEASIRKLTREKEALCQDLEETHKLRVQNQEQQHKLAELQVQSLEAQKLNQEQQNLKTKLNQLEMARMQDQADLALSLVQAQHVRQLQERADEGCRQQVQLLQAQLQEEQKRSQHLEETLRLQVHQSCSQISMKQDQYEKAVAALQQRMEELETKLKGVRLVLQEKVQQLKEQMTKNTKSSVMIKDLYVENSQLMKALHVTEQRQKHAEKKNFLLEEKINALNKLLREIVPVSLAT
ncbi:hypothetical protein PAMP_002021 [Pampus punctatissimus]